MIVAELTEKLKTIPPETKVEIWSPTHTYWRSEIWFDQFDGFGSVPTLRIGSHDYEQRS